jgi:phosphoribosylglycinamide formyltransferase 1
VLSLIISCSGFPGYYIIHQLHVRKRNCIFEPKNNKMQNIAIFASGSGSNAQRIAEYFSGSSRVKITRIFCNRPDAYVLKRAEILRIPASIFTRKDLYESPVILNQLWYDQTDLIVLAGFLWFVPENILDAFHNRIVNIHPALLPKYGGQGMYGNRVHEAVIAAGEKESGITIHFVNGKYDEGKIIFQAKCPVEASDDPESLAKKIHILEHEHYPLVIENLLSSLT